MSRKKPAIWLFIALVLSAAIPVLLLGGWMAYITADQQRSYARRAATEALTQAARRIESEIAREMQVANALANSIAIDHGNGRFLSGGGPAGCRPPALGNRGTDEANREQVLNVLRPLGEPLEPVSDTDSFNAALRSRKPILGGLGVSSPSSASGWWPCVFPEFIERVKSVTCSRSACCPIRSVRSWRTGLPRRVGRDSRRCKGTNRRPHARQGTRERERQDACRSGSYRPWQIPLLARQDG